MPNLFAKRARGQMLRRRPWGGEVKPEHLYDFLIDQAKLNDVLSTELQSSSMKLLQSIQWLSRTTIPTRGKNVFVGSKTEIALRQFAKELNWRSAKETCDAANVVQMTPFSSDRKAMGIV